MILGTFVSIKCYKMFPELKMTSLNIVFCPINSKKNLKIFHLHTYHLSSEKLDLGYFGLFFHDKGLERLNFFLQVIFKLRFRLNLHSMRFVKEMWWENCKKKPQRSTSWLSFSVFNRISRPSSRDPFSEGACERTFEWRLFCTFKFLFESWAGKADSASNNDGNSVINVNTAQWIAENLQAKKLYRKMAVTVQPQQHSLLLLLLFLLLLLLLFLFLSSVCLSAVSAASTLHSFMWIHPPALFSFSFTSLSLSLSLFAFIFSAETLCCDFNLIILTRAAAVQAINVSVDQQKTDLLFESNLWS